MLKSTNNNSVPAGGGGGGGGASNVNEVLGPPCVEFPKFPDNRSRLEIDVFVKDEDLLNLYLQALAVLQTNVDENGNKLWKDDPFSWFQMAAIHGFKLPKWDVPPELLAGVDALPWFDNRGFCSHSSVLFPTWHRVYLTMFEQVLYNIVRSIANKYVDKDLQKRYLEAASRFRLPYWDPMVVRGVKEEKPQWYIPYIIGMPYVWLRLPGPGKENNLTKRVNPLYSYILPPLSEVNAEVIKKIPAVQQGFTVRCPDWYRPARIGERHDERKRSNHKHASEQLLMGQNSKKAISVDIASKFEHLAKLFLVDQLTWNEFSNTNWKETVKESTKDLSTIHTNSGPEGSIEGWHDDVHGLLGWRYTMGEEGDAASGSMAEVPSSSFDPIFWLHHTNCDRLTALYQMTHPDQWLTRRDATTVLTGTEAPNSSAWIKRVDHNAPLGSPVELMEKLRKANQLQKTAGFAQEFSTTPLLPFRKSSKLAAGSWWTSDDVRDWTTLGYSYDGITYINPSTLQSDKAKALKVVQEGKAYASAKYGWMTIENFLNKTPKNGVFPAFLVEARYNVFDAPLEYDNDQRDMPGMNFPEDEPPTAIVDVNSTGRPLKWQPKPKSAAPPTSKPVASKPKPTTEDDLLKVVGTINRKESTTLFKESTISVSAVDSLDRYDDYTGPSIITELGSKAIPTTTSSSMAVKADKPVDISAATVLNFKAKADSKASIAIAKLREMPKFWEWDIAMTVKKFDLQGPFSVFFFLGTYDAKDKSTWLEHPNLLSMNYIFANRNFLDCGNCVSDGDRMYVDSLCLTPKLVDIIIQGATDGISTLKSLDPVDVNPYLQANLKIEVLDDNGEIVTTTNPPRSLKYRVVRREVFWKDDVPIRQPKQEETPKKPFEASVKEETKVTK